MSKAKQLFAECKQRHLHCSISWQSITDYSVEIYRGYKKNYVKVFYTDGYVELNEAIKEALEFLYDNENL